MTPKLPYWRYIDYTDDGCSVYECLSCKHSWEGRSAPGWYTYPKEHETPTYKPVWKFCPHCGIEWLGPIRCNVGNERMLGERRLRIENAINDARFPYKEKVEKWWVIEQVDEYSRAKSTYDIYKISPRYNSIIVHKILTEIRKSHELDRLNNLYLTKKGFRATIKEITNSYRLPEKYYYG